jgi:hypothetical protein
MDLLRAGVGAGALLAGVGVLYHYTVVVPHEHAVAQQGSTQQDRIVLVSPKTGTRLVLSGDGFQLLDKDGHTLAQLAQSDGNPGLTLTQWTVPWSVEWLFQSSGKRSGPPQPKEEASLDLHPTRVFLSGCPSFRCSSNYAALDLNGGAGLVLSSGDMTEGISNLGGFWQSNRCFDAKSTCYATNISLDEITGLSIKTCKTDRGAPLSTTNRNEGCESVHIGSTQLGDVSKGARIVLREDGKPRLAIGRAMLTSPAVGGQEITPISQITAFDKKGAVVWRIPRR